MNESDYFHYCLSSTHHCEDHFHSDKDMNESAIHSDTNDGREVEQEQQEDDNMSLPPLPHLVVDEEEIE